MGTLPSISGHGLYAALLPVQISNPMERALQVPDQRSKRKREVAKDERKIKKPPCIKNGRMQSGYF